MKRWVKDFVTVGLLVVAVVSWWWAHALFERDRVELILWVAETAEEIAFPFRLAELRFREAATELPLPVFGLTMKDVEDSWGFARTEGRTHEGTDLFAAAGTPVFSVTDGYVTDTYFGHRGGNNVMVMGPGGVHYYYAHFERLAAGVERGLKVTPDTVLGYVGTSGNASGTPPHLHFGIYPKPWHPVNPFPLLVDR